MDCLSYKTWKEKPVNIKQHISSFLSTFNEGDIIFYSVQNEKKYQKAKKKIAKSLYICIEDGFI